MQNREDNWARSYKRAKWALRLARLWPTSRGDAMATMKKPGAAESVREELREEIERLDGPELFAVHALVSSLAGARDGTPTIEDLSVWLEAIEDWER